MMRMPRSKKRVKYFCKIVLLWSEREGCRNMLRKKDSEAENMREKEVVMRGAKRRRDEAMFLNAIVKTSRFGGVEL